MRLGYDAKRAFLNTSGLGNYSRNTLNALQSYFPENEYVLYTPEIRKQMLTLQDQFKIVAPPESDSKIMKSWWRNFQLSEELEKQKLSLFHGLSNELPKGIHKTSVPSVVTVHDLIFLRYPEFYKYIDRKIYFEKVKYSCKSATRIIAISEQTKADIIKYTGVAAAKIEIIHQSISPLFFEETATAGIQEKYNLPDEFILAVGTIEERKNQLTILKALQQKKLDIPLVMVGNPTSYCNDIHKYIAAENIKDRVIFLKNIPEKDLAAIYRLAELSVYISVFEGFGLPVIESMACSCPVITSNASCLPETAGDAAILCDPENIDELGEYISRLLNDNAFKNEWIKKGKKRAKEFQAKNYAKRLMNLYHNLMS